MARHLDAARLERQALEAFAEVAEKARRIFAWVAGHAWASAEAKAAARAGLRALAAVERAAPRMIARAVRRLRERLERALKGDGDEAASGSVNAYVEARAPERAPPDLEGPPEPPRYRVHPEAKAPKAGTRVFKRVHADGSPGDPYTLLPDGKPMGTERGVLPARLEGMQDFPHGYTDARASGWPDLNYNGSKAYENFTDAVPVELKAGARVEVDGVARELRPGDRIYRIVDENNPDAGTYWAFELPESKTAWRRDFAVKDSWNDNGYYVEYVIEEGAGPKAWVGGTAGQQYRQHGGADFYLEGGRTQILMTPGAVTPSPPRLTNWPEP